MTGRRAVLEADVGTTARRVLRVAEGHGWGVIGVVTSPVGEDGQVETVLSLRGRRHGGGRFVVLLVDGAVESCWFWRRRHSTLVKGYREVEHVTQAKHGVNLGKKLVHDPELDEVVTWQSERPLPRKVTLRELVGVASRGVPGLLQVDSDES